MGKRSIEVLTVLFGNCVKSEADSSDKFGVWWVDRHGSRRGRVNSAKPVFSLFLPQLPVKSADGP